MRATWTGTLSWGMVAMPVKLGRATADNALSMHQVHVKDGGRIRYAKMCAACGEEIPLGDIAKGAELASGDTVQLTDEDLADLPLPTAHEISVDSFCDAAEIDPAMHHTLYYLWPDTGGGKAYRLLYDALSGSGKVAVCRIAIRTRESLAIVTPRKGVLALVTLYWPDEVREPDFLPALEAAPEPSAAEAKMAATLITMTSAAFSPGDYHDRYSEAVRALIDGQHAVPAMAGSGTAAGADLMTVLQDSLAQARKVRKPAPRRKAKA